MCTLMKGGHFFNSHCTLDKSCRNYSPPKEFHVHRAEIPGKRIHFGKKTSNHQDINVMIMKNHER